MKSLPKLIGWNPKITLNDGLKGVVKDIENALNDKNNGGKSLKNFL